MFKRRRAPIKNIIVWAQCYAALVGVLSTTFPTHVPSLMAYQAIILKAYRDFDGFGWAQYDRAFCRQAAITKDLNWSRINITLYSICFAGKQKHSMVCSTCLSDNHATNQCPETNPWGALNTMFPHPQPFNQPPHAAQFSGPAPKICRLFNHPGGSSCKYNPCKYAHVCSGCGSPHSRAECKRGPKPKRPKL